MIAGADYFLDKSSEFANVKAIIQSRRRINRSVALKPRWPFWTLSQLGIFAC